MLLLRHHCGLPSATPNPLPRGQGLRTSRSRTTLAMRSLAWHASCAVLRRAPCPHLRLPRRPAQSQQPPQQPPTQSRAYLLEPWPPRLWHCLTKSWLPCGFGVKRRRRGQRRRRYAARGDISAIALPWLLLAVPRMCMAYRLVISHAAVSHGYTDRAPAKWCGFLQAQLSAMKAMGQPAAGKPSPTAAPAGSRGPSSSGIPADPAAAMQRLEENLKARNGMPLNSAPLAGGGLAGPTRGWAKAFEIMHCSPAVMRYASQYWPTTHNTRFRQAVCTQFHNSTTPCGAPMHLQVAMAARAELESRELLLRQQLDSTQVTRARFNLCIGVCRRRGSANA